MNIKRIKQIQQKKVVNKNDLLPDVRQSLPTYDELVEALKDTHNLYLKAVKNNYMTHDITRVMGNDNIFNRLESNVD